MFQKSCTLSLLIFAASYLPAQQPGAHLFILSGQSNMAGMKPEDGFRQEAEKLFGDIGYLKVAQGGRPIRLWVQEWDEIAKKHGIDVATVRKNEKPGTQFYQPILDQFKKLIAKHPEPASVTFCWMQGERDARTRLHEAYADAMKQLISNLRRDLNQPKMNFVIGRLSDFSKDEPWNAVRDAQVSVASDDALGAWVDCDDLNNKTKNGQPRDDLHYTKEGYQLLGKRYARQAKLLVEGKAPASNGRPE